MYLNALESQSIPDTDMLSLIYLPNQGCSTVQLSAIEVTKQNQSTSVFLHLLTLF